MSNFRLAKGVVIPNYRFSIPAYMTLSFSQDAYVGANYILVSNVYPVEASLKPNIAFNRGDVLVLTSSHSAFSGESEHVVINRCYWDGSNYRFLLVSVLTKTYLSGDIVSGYGTGWPEGWHHSTTSYANFYESTIKPANGGYSNSFCFWGVNN